MERLDGGRFRRSARKRDIEGVGPHLGVTPTRRCGRSSAHASGGLDRGGDLEIGHELSLQMAKLRIADDLLTFVK